MRFEDWKDGQCNMNVSYVESAARDAWNAALEEAAKVAYQCDKSTHPTDVGHKIMALREEAGYKTGGGYGDGGDGGCMGGK